MTDKTGLDNCHLQRADDSLRGKPLRDVCIRLGREGVKRNRRIGGELLLPACLHLLSEWRREEKFCFSGGTPVLPLDTARGASLTPL